MKKYALIFTLLLMSFDNSGMLSYKKVAVVGAGIAGLTAAYRLKDIADTGVYEARSRVGGRIFTALINDSVAELGAQDISDGAEAVNLNALIDELGLERIERSDPLNLYYCYDNDQKVSFQELLQKQGLPADKDQLKELIDNAALKSKNMQEVLDHILLPDSPLYKIIRVMLAAYEGGSIDTLSPCYANTLYYMLLGGVCAAHQNDGQVPHYSRTSIKGGMSLLPSKLASMLGDAIHINMQLVALSKNKDGKYCLTFKNGQSVVSDIVILCMPCLVYNDIRFETGIIPDDRLMAIKNIRYGTNAKIVVPLSAAVSDTTTYANDQSGAFFGLSKDILTLYHIGKASFFDEDSIAESYQEDHNLLSWRDLACSRTPVLARDELFAHYDCAVAHSWPNDIFAKGSYSYVAAGQEEFASIDDYDQEQVKSLFVPIDQTVYFAGEHASILVDVPGTMEAACESGERVARMVQRYLQSVNGGMPVR